MKGKKTYWWWCSVTHGDRGEKTCGGRQETAGGETREELWTTNTCHKQYQYQLRRGEGGGQQTCQKFQMKNALRIVNP